MASPLSSLAGTISAALSGLFFASTLTRHVEGTAADPSDPPAPTTTDYTCRAMLEDYSQRMRLEGLVEAEDRQVLILATTLAVAPVSGDIVTIGEGPYQDQTFMLTTPITSDPARAVWTCRGQAR